nr:unnamed protein product [Spirometra erinaceieuropaei]
MVDSVVPQGSVLGPILFLIYVDDAARYLDCEVAMFEDDMKIWNVIRDPADEEGLQMNLNRLEEWSNRWLLRFNVAKCGIIRLGNTDRSANTRGYFLGGAALQEVVAQKDLGVLTTSSPKPSAHCSRVAKSAMSVLSLLNKMPLLQTLVFVHCPDIVLGTETWASASVADSELSLLGYNCIRKYRRDSRGGGSCVYVKQTLTFLPLEFPHFSAVEGSCWLQVALKNKYSLLAGCVYRPPNANENFDRLLSQAFHAAADSSFKYQLVAGDFNLPEVRWSPPSGPRRFEDFLEAVDVGM